MRVLNDFVLIRPTGVIEETTEGGIVIPESGRTKPTRGVVIDKGRGEYINGKLIPIDVEPGETVLYSKYADEASVTHDGEDLILVRACEIRLVE